MKILGIDEAGRGCVIGPLVMCGYMTEESNLLFEQIKPELKDSKKLFKLKRQKLNDLLINNQKAKICLQVVEVCEINTQMKNLSLNDIEENCTIKIVRSCNADEIYIDCFTRNKNFAEMFAKKADYGKKFFIEFEADAKYKIVSAASIVAKVTRDAYISKINEKYAKLGFVVGSGYPSDKTTIVFLKQYSTC